MKASLCFINIFIFFGKHQEAAFAGLANWYLKIPYELMLPPSTEGHLNQYISY